MERNYNLKRHFKMTVTMWSIFFVLATVSTYYFIQYRPSVDPYLEWWYPLGLVPVIYGAETYLYRKNKIRVRSDHILFPRPYTRTKKEKMKYEDIEKVAVKSDGGSRYLYSIVDEKYNEYKISNLTGKEIASEMLEVLEKIIDEKDLDVEIVKPQ